MSKNKLKTRVSGTVIEVGWEPHTRTTLRTYAILKIKLTATRNKKLAEEQLKKLQKKILNKKVVIFPEE